MPAPAATPRLLRRRRGYGAVGRGYHSAAARAAAARAGSRGSIGELVRLGAGADGMIVSARAADGPVGVALVEPQAAVEDLSSCVSSDTFAYVERMMYVQ